MTSEWRARSAALNGKQMAMPRPTQVMKSHTAYIYNEGKTQPRSETPARDRYHDIVVRCLIQAGWSIIKE